MFRFGFLPESWLWNGDERAGHLWSAPVSHLRKGWKGRTWDFADVKMARMKSSWKLQLPHRELCTGLVPSEWVTGRGPLWKGCPAWGEAHLSRRGNSQGGEQLRAGCWPPSLSWGTKVFIPEGGPGGALHSAWQSGCPFTGTHHIVSLKVESSQKPTIHLH